MGRSDQAAMAGDAECFGEWGRRRRRLIIGQSEYHDTPLGIGHRHLCLFDGQLWRPRAIGGDQPPDPDPGAGGGRSTRCQQGLQHHCGGRQPGVVREVNGRSIQTAPSAEASATTSATNRLRSSSERSSLDAVT